MWNEIKNILPDVKLENTIGRPIVPYRKVLDGLLFVLRTGYQWKMLPKEYVLVQYAIEDLRMEAIWYF
jgi:transposase